MARSKQSARRPKAKRGDGDASADRANKKQKQQQHSGSSSDSCKADNVLSRLLGGMPISEFMSEYFEKKPLLVRHNANEELFPKGLFSRETLLDLVGEHALEIGKDMTICKIHHMGMCSCDEEDEEDDEDDDADGNGDSESYGGGDSDDESAAMGSPPQPRTLVFHGSLLKPLMQLYTTFPKDIAVSDIVKSSADETETRVRAVAP
ncbi:hypothetical protein P43SY_002949 [Pythium insidiosum]|uniref:Uncharacterized protein n=1 Tax=Pythium insidiosum TaxID=114742 RepID=A0AAD5LG53_PYTIN|nr:hypothetical protein P43SY_002949 [Pythium insidiosum]KAJ0403199.1 hypothetical protein ATCC90586_000170 [Pythium insidiosum]